MTWKPVTQDVNDPTGLRANFESLQKYLGDEDGDVISRLEALEAKAALTQVGGASVAANNDIGTIEETWGAASHTILSSAPSMSVDVNVIFTGYFLSNTSGDALAAHLEISDDGGSGWTDATSQANLLVNTPADARNSMPLTAYYSGTPTGSLLVRVRAAEAISTHVLQGSAAHLVWTVAPTPA